jgi:olefin beta-lactone synthetase
VTGFIETATGVVSSFVETVEANPDRTAIVAQGERITFGELGAKANRFANGLAAHDVRAGTRVAFMVPPGPDAMALCFALFKVGAVPVLIDPGMDMSNLRVCLEEAEPEVFAGIPLAHQARIQLGWGARTVRLNITAGEPLEWGGPSLADFDDQPAEFEAVQTDPDDPAMILFTTGSTGPPKGAVYTVATRDAQFAALREVFDMRSGRVDMPTLPTFSPYTIASGMTSVIPDMDFTRPGEVDAASLTAQIQEHGVESMFGSPALLDRLGRYGAEHGTKLPTLRRIITAAAPVPPVVLERFSDMLAPEAELVVLYGSTEAIPISWIDAQDVISETAAVWAAGGGTCVGNPIDSIETAVMRISDDPVAVWSPDLLAEPGEIGELIVKGSAVSTEYRGQPRANVGLKIYDPADGGIWHRMGDAVKVDERGRLWFQGRVGHRVQTAERTYFTIPTEAIFNQHPRVKRTALVGVGKPGKRQPVLCVELEEGEPREGSEALRRELLELRAGRSELDAITDVLFHPSFPVDIRHNSKIFREKLAVWAEEHLDDEREAVVRKAFDAFASHDPSFFEVIHPDIACSVPEGLPGGGEFRGQLALLEFFTGMSERFDDPMIYPDKIVIGDDELVVFGRWKGVGKDTGIAVDVPVALRWTFKDRLAVGFQNYLDTATVQAAL